MKNQKVDIHKLNQLFRSGKTVKECAEYFDVSPSAISQHKKRMNVAVVKSVQLENATRIVDKSLNAVDQLYKINEQANKLLDDLEHEPKLKIKVMGEIRNQLRLQLEIFRVLYDMEAIAEFQTEVLSIIGECEPDAKDRIINRLKEKRALRSAVRLT